MAIYDNIIPNPVSNAVGRVKAIDYNFAVGDALTTLTRDVYKYALAGDVQSPFFLNKTVEENMVLIAPAYDRDLGYNTTTKQYEKATIASQSIVLNTVLVDVSQARNIVITPLNGVNGTVKEFISDDDYVLQIRGALVNQIDNSPPFDEAKLLYSILSCPMPLEIISNYLQTVFNITNVVVTDKGSPQEEGQANTIYFNITARSDSPVEIHGFKVK